FKKTLKGMDWELIIVDDGSPIKGCFKDQADVFIENKKNLGYAKTMNKGLEKAKGDYIVVANNDIEVYDGWFFYLKLL
ncbi:MAG TPA: polypeptide N-acetylgalactosaminyltransferase, partial [Elusimicrobia bacterium]|nr:polypeptide N-acetylgalactosaminyltransferase [Elusimicrobiota bacterium]